MVKGNIIHSNVHSWVVHRQDTTQATTQAFNSMVKYGKTSKYQGNTHIHTAPYLTRLELPNHVKYGAVGILVFP